MQVMGEDGGVGAHALAVGSHFTLLGSPPVHDEVVLPWQTMSCPQSVSVWQVANWQVLTVGGVTPMGGQLPPSLMQAIAGVATPTEARHDIPLEQSLLLVQVLT
jgi:hypothetical protein